MMMKPPAWSFVLPACAALSCAAPQDRWPDPVTVGFDGGYGQVEVGGRYVGLEFHDGRPLPSRISLYAPVANSLDLSTDYWKRGDSRPFVVGMSLDGGPRMWIGKRPWEYALSPHRVRFSGREGDVEMTLSYDACLDEPACVMSLTVRNVGSQPHALEIYMHGLIALRSCQTYARFDSAHTSGAGDALVFSFDEPELAGTSVCVQNAGRAPAAWTTDASAVGAADSGWSGWIEANARLDGVTSAPGRRLRPAAAFLYDVTLDPGDSAAIVHVLSSARTPEIEAVARRLGTSWRSEIARNDSAVRAAASRVLFHTGDPWLDRSVSYSLALLQANQHFLDGAIVPMPCPAEYNFMFTHDILLTNLSAILVDPARVRRDLLYLEAHARDSVLPHAYYWKDGEFVTEYCAPGNWNYLWFVLATASYLRHTSDTLTVARLVPVLSRGVQLTLSRRRGNVMTGNEPDWWDFGHAEGSRSYLTILTVRALEEYLYLGAVLGFDPALLREYERIAGELRTGLRAELWDDREGYLFNTTGGLRDRHVYMGPLLAAVYGTLPAADARRLVRTAGRELLDPPLGIRTVAPADFHTDSVKAFYNVKGNEAGNPYLYANGGVWYLGNAWYAWALRAVGEMDSAYSFYRRTMTVDGIVRSPRGQPALYEYRYAEADAPDHGWVDKPTMMWSAGYCIGTAYRMIGCEENAWNVSVGGGLPAGLREVEADYHAGSAVRLRIVGSGRAISSILFDNEPLPSRVLPGGMSGTHAVRIEHGRPRTPYLESVNAVLLDARFEEAPRALSLRLSSFAGHRTNVAVISPWEPSSATLNGAQIAVDAGEPGSDGFRRIRLEYGAEQVPDTLTLRFGNP